MRMTRKPPFPQLETAKNPLCSTENLSENQNVFSKNVSGKSHSAENPNEFSILATPLISCEK